MDNEKRKNAKPKMAVWKKLLIVIGVLLLVLAVEAAGVLWTYEIELSLKGQDTVTLECGSIYEDPGVEVSYRGAPLFGDVAASDVQVQGTVETDKVGTYEIDYTVSRELNYFFGTRTYQASAKRTVHVVDTTAPVITLLTKEGYFTLPGSAYQEEGYTAQDICDGDVTGHVETWTEGDLVYYQVADAAGNTAQVTRQIVYSDPVAPELVLEGKLEHILLVGSEYVEPGYRASDNCDGDLTQKVTVTGAVDTGTMGTYQLEYTVTDAAGNVSKAVRIITVRDYPAPPDNLFPGQAEEPVAPGDKVVYLTFDDGPSKFTPMLLDVLKKYNVKATFFVVNRGYHDVLKRIADEGHTLAMHCSEHTYRKIYASEEAYFKDLKEIQDVIYEVTGQKSTIVRFPGGSDNTASSFNPGVMTRLTKMLDEMGYRYFDWNVNSADCEAAETKDSVANYVIYGIQRHNVSVVLQHDIKGFSVMAVERIIQWGLENGYTFLPLTNNSPVCESELNN